MGNELIPADVAGIHIMNTNFPLFQRHLDHPATIFVGVPPGQIRFGLSVDISSRVSRIFQNIENSRSS
jgi:hypothetical protein